MRHGFWAALGCHVLFFTNTASLNARDAQKAPTLRVRGTPLQLPFEIRILVDSFDANKPVRIEGYKMQVGSGRKVSEELNCKTSEKFSGLHETLLKNPFSDSGSVWSCKGPGWNSTLGLTPLRLSPTAGFLTANEKLYRGELEIFVKDGKLQLINSLPLEPYLAGLINKEIRSDYPEEAVKAQIVAARSYAVAKAAERRSRGWLFDMYGTEADQVYEGSLYEDSKSHRLVRETFGEVLLHQEEVLKAYYHAANGGFSELPQNVWLGEGHDKDRLAYLARQSPVDKKHAPFRWQVSLSPKMGLTLPGKLGEIKNLRVLEVTPGQRVKKILMERQYGVQVLNGPEFRALFGNRWIKSTYFKITKVNKNWLVQGQGFGHGVGLSQLGAKAMGKLGKSHLEILKFYYPYSTVRKIDLGEDLYIPPGGTPPNLAPGPLAR